MYQEEEGGGGAKVLNPFRQTELKYFLLFFFIPSINIQFLDIFIEYFY